MCTCSGRDEPAVYQYNIASDLQDMTFTLATTKSVQIEYLGQSDGSGSGLFFGPQKTLLISLSPPPTPGNDITLSLSDNSIGFIGSVTFDSNNYNQQTQMATAPSSGSWTITVTITQDTLGEYSTIPMDLSFTYNSLLTAPVFTSSIHPYIHLGAIPNPVLFDIDGDDIFLRSTRCALVRSGL